MPEPRRSAILLLVLSGGNDACRAVPATAAEPAAWTGGQLATVATLLTRSNERPYEDTFISGEPLFSRPKSAPVGRG